MKESSNPLVTVVVPCYNSAKYIIETVDSIKAQTYKNIEIVLVDDKSTDNTLDIIKNIQNIIVIENTYNKGVNQSLNDALSYCNGKYLIIFGHDDVMMESRIEKQVYFMETNECLASFGNSYFIYGDLKSNVKISKNIYKSFIFNRCKNSFLLFALGLSYNSNSAIFKKDIVVEVGGYEIWFPNYDESYLFYKVALQGQIYYQDEVLSFYRKHNDSLTAKLVTRIDKLETFNKYNQYFLNNYQFKKLFFYKKLFTSSYYIKKTYLMLKKIFKVW